jgi:hypothetical protein
MTGEERLGIALRLHELACNLAREANEAEVERFLQQRLALATK